MSTVRRGDIVQTLPHRGDSLEAGQGMNRVVGALEGCGNVAATEGNAGLVTPVPSDRIPALMSRLRRDLQAEGVVFSEMGKASSGRHTVVTLRLPSGAKSALVAGARAAGVDFICLAEAGSR